jgi:alkaline phosphatase D
MHISRRDFCALLALADSPAPVFATTRPLAPMAADVDRDVFAHGVASGDPLRDRVILWTRVTPRGRGARVPVRWAIALDPGMRRIVHADHALTDADSGYTVKIDVDDLAPGATYYYRFFAAGARSPIGRTRTLPAGDVDRLRFAVASCSNYPFGFFNAYRSIGERADLDAVLHLGDYLYEYANGTYGDGTVLGRLVRPQREIVSLDDYRERHALYKSDIDLQEAHRQHPFITVWDDHESTNDAWREGAENHQPDTEGDWPTRKAASIRAYFEWMPIRGRAREDRIYRRFRFGRLAELVMLDTRLVGRDRQAANGTDAATIGDPSRQLLGAAQERFLFERLIDAQRDGVQWRLLGQQIMMAQLSLDFGKSVANADQWDGYRPARERLYDVARANGIDNIVVLAGDIHSSWGSELASNPFDPRLYDGASGRGSLGVELIAPGVTSPFLFPDTPEGAAQAAVAAQQIRAISPHIKNAELFRRGYLLVDVTRERVQGEWYYAKTLRERDAAHEFGSAFASAAGSNTLRPAAGPSTPAGDAPDLAP